MVLSCVTSAQPTIQCWLPQAPHREKVAQNMQGGYLIEFFILKGFSIIYISSKNYINSFIIQLDYQLSTSWWAIVSPCRKCAQDLLEERFLVATWGILPPLSSAFSKGPLHYVCHVPCTKPNTRKTIFSLGGLVYLLPQGVCNSICWS